MNENVEIRHKRFRPVWGTAVLIGSFVLFGAAVANAVAAYGFRTQVLSTGPQSAGSCVWVRAYYKNPGNTYAVDFSTVINKEPQAGCNMTSPWNNFVSNEAAQNVILWTFDRTTICNLLPDNVVAGGSPGSGWAWGMSTSLGGVCAGHGKHLQVEARARGWCCTDYYSSLISFFTI